jgi:hypothetical protein
MTSFQLAEALQEAIDAAYAEWQERTATLLGRRWSTPICSARRPTDR